MSKMFLLKSTSADLGPSSTKLFQLSGKEWLLLPMVDLS